MSDETTAAIPAGWYQDPADPARQRWWDGTRWTASVRQITDQPVAPLTGAIPVVTTPAASSSNAPLQPISGSGAAATGAASSGYVPFRQERSHIPVSQSGIAYTRTGWWLGFQPLWGIVPQVVIIVMAFTFDTTLPGWIVVIADIVLNLILLGVLVLLAFADRRALLAGGNRSAASPWWVLLSPLVYLVVRARDVRAWQETGPYALVIWWSISFVLSPALVFLGIFAVLGILPV